MWSLIKFIIWIVGLVVVSYLVLRCFGYDVNRDYFNQSKDACQEKLKECRSELIHQGIDNAKCNFECVDPKLIINKQGSRPSN